MWGSCKCYIVHVYAPNKVNLDCTTNSTYFENNLQYCLIWSGLHWTVLAGEINKDGPHCTLQCLQVQEIVCFSCDLFKHVDASEVQSTDSILSTGMMSVEQSSDPYDSLLLVIYFNIEMLSGFLFYIEI